MKVLSLNGERPGIECSLRSKTQETEKQFLYEMATKAKDLLCSTGIDLSGYSVEVIDAHEYRKEILLMSTERREIVVVQDNYDEYVKQNPEAGLLRMFATLFYQSVQAQFHEPLQKILERRGAKASDWITDAAEMNMQRSAFGQIFAVWALYTVEENEKLIWKESSNRSINLIEKAILKALHEISPKLEDTVVRSLAADFKAAAESFDKEGHIFFRSFIQLKERSFSREGISDVAKDALEDLMATTIAKVILPNKAYAEMKLTDMISLLKDLRRTECSAMAQKDYVV